MGTRRQLLSLTNLTIIYAMGLSQAYAQSSGGATKLYELRIYTANAGKFADFQRAFRSQALRLFTKYGIENVFDGAVLEGARADGSDAANMLVCILAHQNRAAAERSRRYGTPWPGTNASTAMRCTCGLERQCA